MSVQSPIYILWGLMLPYPKGGDVDDTIYGKCEPYIDSAYDSAPKPGTTILWGEEYVAVGHVLARSGPYGDDLGTHTIPTLYPASDPFGDPAVVKRFDEWRDDITKALRSTGLDIGALGLSFGWHVIQHYR